MRFVAFGLFALWGILLAGAEPSWIVPRYSYLVRPVSSAHDLANQIRTEPVVAQRYARHFGRSAFEIAEHFEKNLYLTKLEKAETFNVYYAPPDNRLLVERKTLPKGTPVFVDKKTRKPVLKANCGNPLTPAVSIQHQPIQTTPLPVVSRVTPHLAQEVTLPEVPTVELVELPLEEVVAADVLPTETLAETMPETPIETTEALAEALPTPTTPIEPIVRRGGSPWWLLIPLGGLLFREDNNNNLPPIPEPSSLLAIGAGFSLLYPSSRKAFKRSQKRSQRDSTSTTDSA